LAPSKRDSQEPLQNLSNAGILAEMCPDMKELCAKLHAGAGAALIVDGALGKCKPSKWANTFAD